MELLLTGDAIDAETAAALGARHRVVPADKVMDTATRLRAPHRGQCAAGRAGGEGARAAQARHRVSPRAAPRTVRQPHAAAHRRCDGRARLHSPSKRAAELHGELTRACAAATSSPASATPRFGKLPGRDTISLNVEACRNALADAGIEKDAVDALLVKPPTSKPQFMYGQTVAEAMGIQPRVGGAWDQGGAANIDADLVRHHGDRARPVRGRAGLLRRQSAHRQPQRVYDGAGRRRRLRLVRRAGGLRDAPRRHIDELRHATATSSAPSRSRVRKHGAANPDAQLRQPLDARPVPARRRGWSTRCAATIARWCRTAPPPWC